MRHLLLSLLATLAASAETWYIDAAGSTVAFAGTSTFHDFTGTAKLRTAGVMVLDPAAPSGSIEADAGSMTTASEGRDERMRNFVMDSPTHPSVRFELTGWKPTATGGTATGTWSMVGVDRPVSCEVTLVPGSPARARARLELNIRQWGIRTPRLIVVTVGDIVTVDLDLALVREAPAAK